MPYPPRPDLKPAATPAPDGAPPGAATAAPGGAPVSGTAGPAMPVAAGRDSGLSTEHHVVELADALSAVADRLHERIGREIAAHRGGVPPAVQAAMRSLLDDEMLLRQRANGLYADAAAHVIVGLGQPQGRLMALTTGAAEKIRRIGVLGEVTSLVGGVLSLAGAVASGQPTPIALALEKIEHHAAALDALAPPASPA